MNIAPHSLAAYDTVDLTARQADVLAALVALHEEGKRPSDQDVAEHLGWTINRVTPRRGELVDLDRVVRAGEKFNAAGNTVAVWLPVPKQLDLVLG